MNTYVLWLIGGQLERIVGGGRVLALFTAGVLGGGLAVALVPGTPLTWGASGGIWALLVAQGWLGFFPRGLIPEPVAAGVKRAARTNLIINVLISLAPGISGLGHLGGGIGGLVLAAAGAMHRGIAVDEDATVAPRHPLQLVPLVACGLLLVGAFAVAMAVGQPWAGAVL
jgi:membrane associated rhomboid family serine protease